MADIIQPLEGEVRVNPQTQQREIYTPEGMWEVVTPEMERARMGVPGAGVPSLPTLINAGDVKDATGVDVGNLPALDNKSISSLTTATAGLPAYYQSQYSESLKKEEEAKKLQAELGAKPKTDVTGAQATAQTQYEVPEWLRKTQEQSVKVAALQGEIDKINVLQLQEIDQVRAQLANVPTYIIDRQENQINRQYASQKAYKAAELGGEAALLQAYSGNLTEARNLANDAVDAYTYDIQQKRADFDSLYNIYGDWITSLDKDQQSILDNARQEAIREEDNAKKDATQVMEWAIQYAGAGIKITDTVEEAAKKASAYQAGLPKTGNIPTIKNINGVDMQWNGTTWEPVKTTLNQPRDYQDTELKTLAQAYKDTEKMSYEAALADIDATASIQNKERAKEIVSEIYGKGKSAGKSLIQKVGEFFTQPFPLPIKETGQQVPLDKLTSWLKGVVKTWNPQTGLQPKK